MFPDDIQPGLYRISVVFPGDRRLNSLRACYEHVKLICGAYPQAMVPASPAEENPPLDCDICRISKIPALADYRVETDTVQVRILFTDGRAIQHLYLCHTHLHVFPEHFVDTRGIANTGQRVVAQCDVCLYLSLNRFIVSVTPGTS